jgi:nitrate reductase NapD
MTTTTTQPPELHIASLVVHALPARLAAVQQALGDVQGAEIHAASPEGKLVVTLEQPSADAMTDAVVAVQRLPGVLAATLVWQGADTLEAMNEEIPDAKA